MAGRGTDILLGRQSRFKTKQKLIAEGYTKNRFSAAIAFNNTTDQEELKIARPLP
jgi:preprotein translocase subunit SecA